MRMNDIMLDIETLSTNSNAVILSIGAVQFDLKSGEVGKSFHVKLHTEEQVKNGGVVSPSTAKWWSEQTQEAQDMVFSGERLKMLDALKQFNNWISDNFKDTDDTRMWGNGATFDNVIVRNLYSRCNLPFVLPYWCDTDVRTLTQLEDYDKVKELTGPFIGVKHDAIDDCKHQIRMCKIAYDLVKGLT